MLPIEVRNFVEAVFKLARQPLIKSWYYTPASKAKNLANMRAKRALKQSLNAKKLSPTILKMNEEKLAKANFILKKKRLERLRADMEANK
jgi:hypothetical protein